MARLPHIEGVGATAAPGAIVVFDWTATAGRRPSSSLVEPIRRIDELSLRKTLVWPYFLEGCPRILRLSAGAEVACEPLPQRHLLPRGDGGGVPARRMCNRFGVRADPYADGIAGAARRPERVR